MDDKTAIAHRRQLPAVTGLTLPSIIDDAGERARKRFAEFFTAEIRNPNTREAYARAVAQFCEWCSDQGIGLADLSPVLVSAYIEGMTQRRSAPTVKQHLAAIRMLCDYLVIGQVLESNPAAPVRGPKYSIQKGKTPVLSADQARQLLDSINGGTIVGLRDRALIGVKLFSFARVSAVLDMDVGDYYRLADGRRASFRLKEKGGKFHQVPAHHKAEEYVEAHLAAGNIRRGPLFRTVDRRRHLTERRMQRKDALRMVKRRAKQAGISDTICCHTFRATGITNYLKHGGTVEKAAQIAAHSNPKTTSLYDRRNDDIDLDEIERNVI